MKKGKKQYFPIIGVISAQKAESEGLKQEPEEVGMNIV